MAVGRHPPEGIKDAELFEHLQACTYTGMDMQTPHTVTV